MNHTRFPRTRALNDSNLVRISLQGSWDSVDIGEQKFVIRAMVIIIYRARRTSELRRMCQLNRRGGKRIDTFV